MSNRGRPPKSKRSGHPAKLDVRKVPVRPEVSLLAANLWMNEILPTHLAPLYALIGAFRFEHSGKVVATSLEESFQLALSFHLLGLDAQLVVANVLVSSQAGSGKPKFWDVGVWDQMPTFDTSQRQYNGHVFIYSQQYRRMIDVAIPHCAVTVGAVRASEDWDISLPVVLEIRVPVPLHQTRPTTFRDGRAITYTILQADPDNLTSFFRDADSKSELLAGSSRIAHAALRALKMAEIEDSSRWKQHSPAVRNIIDNGAIDVVVSETVKKLVREPFWIGSGK